MEAECVCVCEDEVLEGVLFNDGGMQPAWETAVLVHE